MKPDRELAKQKALFDLYKNLSFLERSFDELIKQSEDAFKLADAVDVSHPLTYLQVFDKVERLVKDVGWFSRSSVYYLRQYRKLDRGWIEAVKIFFKEYNITWWQFGLAVLIGSLVGWLFPVH